MLNNNGWRHAKAIWYERNDKIKFDSFYKFTFVKNPIERFKSAYSYLKRGGENDIDTKWSNKHLSKFESINEVISNMEENRFREKILSEAHFEPQYKYLKNEEGKINIDFIGRVESIKKDFQKVKKRIGLDHKRLPQKNKSNKKDMTINRSQKSVLKKIYKKDFELFDYDL